MKNIQLLNKIAKIGTDKLDPALYNIGAEVAAPEGIMVRSANMLDMDFNPELLTIARAEMLLLQEKPDEALCLLSSIQTAVPARLIGQSLLKGQAYFMMGNQELAKIWLNQVLQSGNRLIGSIEQAKNLLKEMEE